MRRAVGLVGCAILAAFALVAAPAAAQKLDTKDANFVKDAAQCGMLEFELAKLAATNASSEDVKQFGKRIVDAHAKVNQELTTLASNKGVTLPKILEDKKCKEVCDKLSKLKGKDFDREYMRQTVEDHEKALTEFQTAAKSLSDPDLKAWVTKALPTLSDHLRQAKEIQAKIK
jgi:putative membrane protein